MRLFLFAQNLFLTPDFENRLRVNFSEYRRWIPKETLYEIVATGQQMQQLYLPGFQENCMQTLGYIKSKFCMARLVPNLADSTQYTLLEQRIWGGTGFTFMWPNLRVESLHLDPALCPLRKEEVCPFMLWVTLPREYATAMMSCTLEAGWNF